MTKKYKVLLFDLDDTIIDNLENIRWAFKKMVEHEDELYTDDNFKRWYEIDKKFWNDWQDGLIEVPEKFKNETYKKSEEFLNWLRGQRALMYFENRITLEKAVELNNLYIEAMREIVKPIDGAYETLEYLANTNKYIILVVTNGPGVATNEKLSKINCLNLVDEVLSADMFGYMKPRKEFYETIQQRLNNYNNDEYLIIGDSLKSDVGFGMNCGFDSCWVNRSNKEISGEYIPTKIINELIELQEWL